MKIWKNPANLEFLNSMSSGNMVEHLGIEIKEVGDDFIKASMPVDHRTRQPMGLLHGGASVALSETMGSFAGVLILDDVMKQSVVGIEINANHLRAVKSGYVHATTTAIRIGRKLQVWNTNIRDDDGRLVCTSRLTTMVVDRE